MARSKEKPDEAKAAEEAKAADTKEVIAVAKGFHGDRRSVGERFTVPADLESKWFVPVEDYKPTAQESEEDRIAKAKEALQGPKQNPRNRPDIPE